MRENNRRAVGILSSGRGTLVVAAMESTRATVAMVPEDVVAVAAEPRVVAEDPVALAGFAVELAISEAHRPRAFLMKRQVQVGCPSSRRCRWWSGQGFLHGVVVERRKREHRRRSLQHQRQRLQQLLQH